MVDLIARAHRIVEESVVAHERQDETIVYPRLIKVLADSHGLSAMSRAHREILHQARLLGRLAYGLRAEDADKYLVRDAQRAIELSKRSFGSTTLKKKTSTSTRSQPSARREPKAGIESPPSPRPPSPPLTSINAMRCAELHRSDQHNTQRP